MRVFTRFASRQAEIDSWPVRDQARALKAAALYQAESDRIAAVIEHARSNGIKPPETQEARFFLREELRDFGVLRIRQEVTIFCPFLSKEIVIKWGEPIDARRPETWPQKVQDRALKEIDQKKSKIEKIKALRDFGYRKYGHFPGLRESVRYIEARYQGQGRGDRVKIESR